jgi:hypothetical protein
MKGVDRVSLAHRGVQGSKVLLQTFVLLMVTMLLNKSITPICKHQLLIIMSIATIVDHLINQNQEPSISVKETTQHPRNR